MLIGIIFRASPQIDILTFFTAVVSIDAEFSSHLLIGIKPITSTDFQPLLINIIAVNFKQPDVLTSRSTIAAIDSEARGITLGYSDKLRCRVDRWLNDWINSE